VSSDVESSISKVKNEMPTHADYTIDTEMVHKCVQHLFPEQNETEENAADEENGVDEGNAADEENAAGEENAADEENDHDESDESLQLDPPKITLEQCSKNSSLLHAKVQWLIAKGDENGYPEKKDVPGSDTIYTQVVMAHKQMVFLNRYSVYNVLEKLRDMGLFPVIMKDTPHGRWCNFAQVLYTFAILYCHYEG